MRGSKWLLMLGVAAGSLTPSPTVAAADIGSVVTSGASSTRAEREALRRTAREERRAAKRKAKAIRQAQENGADAVAYQGANGADIVVTGLRKSVQDSIQKKKNSREIVDSVTAEDAGKLPDNNVVEAMARITGVDITRSNGRGNGFTIRGLDGVQTTINGRNVEAAGDRSIDLSSIAPELVKGIDVYKTRGADQPEGGIGGSVNIELRRPLDLKKGWTIAGGFNETFNSQGKTKSPDGSILVGKRIETPIGEMGLLLTGAYYETKFLEPNATTESPDHIGFDPKSAIRLSLPANVRDTVLAPYRGFDGLNYGSQKSPTVYGSYQWKVNDHLSFVAEGTWIHNVSRTASSNMYMFARQDYYTISNPTIIDNLLVRYDVSNQPPADGSDPANFGRLDAYNSAGLNYSKSNQWVSNFEIHWNSGIARLDSSAQFNRSDGTVIYRGYDGYYPGLTQARIDFESPDAPAGGPVYTFFGVDPSDPTQQRINSFSDNLNTYHSKNWAGQQDLSLDTQKLPFLKSVQIGWRYSTAPQSYNYSYRYARVSDPSRTSVTLASVPGVGSQVFSPPIQGAKRIQYSTLDPVRLFDNWFPAVTNFIIANNPVFRDGIGRGDPVSSQFSTPNPSGEDATAAGTTKENTFAAYANLNWAFKALFPVDGTAGLRYVNTVDSVSGRTIQEGQILTDPKTKKPILDADGNQQFLPDTFLVSKAKSNFIDVTPALFGNAHFTDKLQLRVSWTKNVQRPNPLDLRDYRQINFSDPNADVYAGNPNLKPVKTTDWNVALEWYFSKNGLVSLTFFNKNQTGFNYYTRQREPVPELGGALRYVDEVRNAGPGQTRGLEAQATGFFSFLPGILHNLGGTVNATWIPTARVSLPVERSDAPGVYDLVPERSPFTSTLTYNLIGYYESEKVSLRVTYNWRSKYKTGADAVTPFWVQDSPPTSRLDAAFNYTPFKFLTLVLEGQNLTQNVEKFYYDYYPDLRAGSNQMGRTIKAGARFRF